MIKVARDRSESVRHLVSKRNAAWGPKQRADKDAEALRQRFGRSFSLEEKRSRLQAKAAAAEAFRKASAQAEDALDTALFQRWTTTSGYLSELCSCISTVFEDTQPLVHGCR